MNDNHDERGRFASADAAYKQIGRALRKYGDALWEKLPGNDMYAKHAAVLDDPEFKRLSQKFSDAEEEREDAKRAVKRAASAPKRAEKRAQKIAQRETLKKEFRESRDAHSQLVAANREKIKALKREVADSRARHEVKKKAILDKWNSL